MGRRWFVDEVPSGRKPQCPDAPGLVPVGTLTTVLNHAAFHLTPVDFTPPAGNIFPLEAGNGGIAQLVERVVRNDEVSGSTPLISTSYNAGKLLNLRTLELIWCVGRFPRERESDRFPPKSGKTVHSWQLFWQLLQSRRKAPLYRAGSCGRANRPSPGSAQRCATRRGSCCRARTRPASPTARYSSPVARPRRTRYSRAANRCGRRAAAATRSLVGKILLQRAFGSL